MLKLSELKPSRRSTKRRKVIGRGLGSGHGTYSGRGGKGQTARSGSSIQVGFEGGRMPLHRQIPKRRGFKSRNPKAEVVSFSLLSKKFNNGETVNPKILSNRGLVKSPLNPIKVLGEGELTKNLTFEKIGVSKTAREKIEK